MVSTRSALERLWRGVCDVYERQPVQDPITKLTSLEPVRTVQGQKCKLSFQSVTSAGDGEAAATVTQKAKLFIGPEISIPPGSKIIVTQNGRTAEYERSGEPAVFTNHQEISLELFKGWA